MKKILLSARDMKIGGIEKSLINLIKYLIEHGYQVTLVLEKKDGELLRQIPKSAKIVEYSPCSFSFTLFRKIINMMKELKFIMLYKNKFDISISYATYSKTASFVARTSSKKSILWCHADYFELFQKDKKKVINFFKEIRYKKFSKIVFVSRSAKDSFLAIFPNQQNVYFCNNLIDSDEILKKSKEQIELKYNSSLTTFLNVGRHDEHQKKLTRVIEAAALLKNDGYKFRIIFIGKGQDTEKYKELIKSYNLEKNILLIGKKENPYPYFKISDCVVLSSDYEGYPVVFLESYVLNKPIITTNVSDYEEIENKRGIVVNKNQIEIYKAMKEFIEKRFEIKEKFNANEYNKKIKKQLEKILNE